MHAQVAGARLTGAVKDFSDAVIPNSELIVTEVPTGVSLTISPGGAGPWWRAKRLGRKIAFDYNDVARPSIRAKVDLVI